MCVQSNLYEDMYGFSIIRVMIVQITIVVACYWIGGCFFERQRNGRSLRLWKAL